MTKPSDDFASGMFADQPSGGEDWQNVPRDEHGTARVAVFIEPARSSAELERREAEHLARVAAGEHVYFCDEDGNEQQPELTPEQIVELKQHFTAAEWAELERVIP